ncbi:MAG: hypothetical protein HDP34_03775 [Clostridia bacterium]|nr:hypothetical protein [Clostridia bacterium]
MKSKTRLKLLLICSSALVASFAAFAAGCAVGAPTTDSILEENNAKDQCITYYAAGGTFDGDELTEKNMYFVANSPFYTFTDASGESTLVRVGYIFNGWYKVETDENGEPKFNADGTPILTSDEVNATNRIQQGEHWYVAADWIRDQFVSIRLGGNATIKGTDGKDYTGGDEIAQKNFGKSGTLSLTDASPMASTDYTFLQYYTDENCTQLLTGSITKPESGNAVVYAKYIQGVYDIVRNSSQVRSMLVNLNADKAYYIYTTAKETGEERVIDCQGMQISFKTGEFNCRIEGNGYTIKNLNFVNDVTSVSAGQTYSIFGSFTEKASVSNLAFSDVTASVNAGMRANVSVYLISHGIEEGAQFSEFKVENISLSVKHHIDYPIKNIPQDNTDNYNTDNWMFGGMNTDAAFIAKYTGLTVRNYELTVNETKLVPQN